VSGGPVSRDPLAALVLDPSDPRQPVEVSAVDAAAIVAEARAFRALEERLRRHVDLSGHGCWAQDLLAALTHDRAAGSHDAPPARAATPPAPTSPGAGGVASTSPGGAAELGPAVPPGNPDWPPPPELRFCPNCNQALGPHGCSACNWPDPWEDQG
jgi:hypothetical protein